MASFFAAATLSFFSQNRDGFLDVAAASTSAARQSLNPRWSAAQFFHELCWDLSRLAVVYSSFFSSLF